MDFTLDTSGHVGPPAGLLWPRPYWRFMWIGFNHLTPFMRGYVRAAMLDTQWPNPAESFGPSSHVIRFDWLAPEALEVMIVDCEAFLTLHPTILPLKQVQEERGREFWRLRQGRSRPDFPPLTLSLGDDGKVRI